MAIKTNKPDPIPRLIEMYGELIDLPMFGLGSHKPRLYLAKQITAALEVATIAEQERYYTGIHELRVARAKAETATQPAADAAEELIEWG